MNVQIEEVELNLPRNTLLDLRALAIEGHPFEVCGVLYVDNSIHQLTNTYCGDKRHGFDMEIDIQDKEILAIWHSHPEGPETLSNNDLPCLSSLTLQGFNYPWLVVTPYSVTEWIGVL